MEALLEMASSHDDAEDKLPEQAQANIRNVLLKYLYKEISPQSAKEALMSIVGNHNKLDTLESIINSQESPPQISSPSDTEKTKNRPWRTDEDYRLIAAIYRFGKDQWSQIANFVGNGRTKAQCHQRWNRALSPGISKSAWTPEEEAKLLDLVSKNGESSWKLISSKMGNRTDVQCRYMYSKLKKDQTANSPVQNDYSAKQWQGQMMDQMSPMMNQNMMKSMSVNQNQLSQQMQQMQQTNLQQYMQNAQQKSLDQLQMPNSMQQLSNILMQTGQLGQLSQNPFAMNAMQSMQYPMQMPQNSKMHQQKSKKPRNQKQHPGQMGSSASKAAQSKQQMQSHMMQGANQPMQQMQSQFQQSMQANMQQMQPNYQQQMQQMQQNMQSQQQSSYPQMQQMQQMQQQTGFPQMSQQPQTNYQQQMQQQTQNQNSQYQSSMQSMAQSPYQQQPPQPQMTPTPTQITQIGQPTPLNQMPAPRPIPEFIDLNFSLPVVDAQWYSEY